MTVHNFQESLARGTKSAHKVISYMSRKYGWHVEVAAMSDELRGVDYWITTATGSTVAIEVKSDFAAATTGNVFVETVSNFGKHKLGWGLTCESDFILYAVPGKVLCATTPKIIKFMLVTQWLKCYKLRRAKNETYESEGVLVPLSEFLKCSKVIYKQKEGDTHASHIN